MTRRNNFGIIQKFEKMNLIPYRNTGVVKGGALDEFAHKKRDRVSNLQLTSATGTVQYTAIITKRREIIKESSRTKDNDTDDIDIFDYDPTEPPHKTYIAFATNDPSINITAFCVGAVPHIISKIASRAY